MASGLRAKLNRIAAGTPKAEKKPERACGVLQYADSRPMDARLNCLNTEGLRRIGFEGNTFDIRRCLFLDTETTGLSGGAGTVAFLVGLGWVEGNSFVVKQYLMRDYSDEAEMLTLISEKMRGFDICCTFNGKTFDLPLIKTRLTMCRMPDKWREFEQLDLLAPSRRTWKLRLGSCRLARIEEFILGQGREDDLPGSEVPQRYFSFLKSGDINLLQDIIDHNRQDIYTLGTLLAHLCELYADPIREEHKEDLFSMGKALEGRGELKVARELYRLAAVPTRAGSISALKSGDALSEQASWRLYLLAKKNRDTEEMREILERMALRRQMRGEIYIELAKLYEHRYKNYRRALRYAEIAAKYAPAKDREALDKRRGRLKAKIEKETGRKNNHGIF